MNNIYTIKKCYCGSKPSVRGRLIECSNKYCRHFVQTHTCEETVKIWNKGVDKNLETV